VAQQKGFKKSNVDNKRLMTHEKTGISVLNSKKYFAVF
jgi:hypothetical protein